MPFTIPNIVELFNTLAFSEFSYYAAFAIVVFVTLGSLTIILRFLYFLASSYFRRSSPSATGAVVFAPGRIAFRTLGAGAFLMTGLIAAFLSISAIAIFINALWMAATGTPGLLRATEVLYAPRTDSVLHFLLALIYAVLAGGAILSAYALWPFRRDWIAWNDRLQAGHDNKPADRASRVFVLQTFAFTNVAAVFFTILLLYNAAILLAEATRDPAVVSASAENIRVQSLLILAAIVAGNGMAAFALWPMRRAADHDHAHHYSHDYDHDEFQE